MTHYEKCDAGTHSIATTITKGADALETNRTFSHNRAKYMNASEAGSCIRSQWFSKHAPESAAKQDWGFARRGHMIEKWAISAINAANEFPLMYAGHEQMSLVDDKNHIAGTPDGLVLTHINNKAMSGVLEIKSFDGFTKKENLPRRNHVIQTQINIMLFSAHPELLTFDNEYYPVEFGKLVYINASNFDDIVEFWITPPSLDDTNAWKIRAKTILKTKKVGKLDREGKRENNGKACRYCPFTQICGVNITELAKYGDSIEKRKYTGSTIDEAAKEYISIQTVNKTNDERKRVLKEIIITELRKRSVRELMIGNNIKITLSSVSGRKSFDATAAKAAGIDVSRYYKTGKSSDRLIVEDLSAQ